MNARNDVIHTILSVKSSSIRQRFDGSAADCAALLTVFTDPSWSDGTVAAQRERIPMLFYRAFRVLRECLPLGACDVTPVPQSVLSTWKKVSAQSLNALGGEIRTHASEHFESLSNALFRWAIVPWEEDGIQPN